MSESTSQGLYTIDEQVTIRRGKRSGQTATVLDVNQADSVYAVRYADGGFGAVNHENVKVRVEPTITKTDLTDKINQATDLPSLIGLLNQIPGWD